MLLSKERILYLLDGYSEGTVTEGEEQELFDWLKETGNHDLILQHIEKLVHQPVAGHEAESVDWDKLYRLIIASKGSVLKPVRVRRWPIWYWAAAVALLVVLGIGATKYLNQPSKKAVVQAEARPLKADVAAPTESKAVLTLADGTIIDLDSIGNGTLARQGSVQVIKKPGGQIAYQGTGSEALFNVLNVPRGSRVVTIQLADGTQVWLNNESSLRYPASFAASERKVFITGEAYFEVAHQAAPFVVTKDAMEVTVLGTHFNMNTYNDESTNKVTLLEGAVEVKVGGSRKLLKPGQQAQVSNEIRFVNGADLEAVMAWKNGLFQFGDNADLQQIMRRISRWYDVDIFYEGTVTDQHFGGEIPMNSNLSQVLEILRTSGVKFVIEGKKVVVKS